MNELVLVSQKTRKLFGPKKLRGYFPGAKFFRRVFLNRKCSYSATNCSRELPHNNPNSKLSLVVVIINYFSSFKL